MIKGARRRAAEENQARNAELLRLTGGDPALARKLSLEHPLAVAVRVAVVTGLVLSGLAYLHPDPALPVAFALVLVAVAVVVFVVGAVVWVVGRLAAPKPARTRLIRQSTATERVGAMVVKVAYGMFMTGGVIVIVVNVVRLITTQPWSQ
jgi:hypothetical protein